MSFQKGRPLKNLLYAVTHPLQTAEEKPLLFMLMIASAVIFGGIGLGFWDMNSILRVLPFQK